MNPKPLRTPLKPNTTPAPDYRPPRRASTCEGSQERRGQTWLWQALFHSRAMQLVHGVCFVQAMAVVAQHRASIQQKRFSSHSSPPFHFCFLIVKPYNRLRPLHLSTCQGPCLAWLATHNTLGAPHGLIPLLQLQHCGLLQPLQASCALPWTG